MLDANHAEIAELKALHAKHATYEKDLEEQRDLAYKQLDNQSPLIPWYLWTALGFIAGTAAAWRFR